MNNPDTTVELQSLIDRMMAGDATARPRLLERAYWRLERIVAKTLHRSYSNLANRHDTASIISETYLRLSSALESVQAKADQREAPMNVTDFFRLVASKAHQVCIDLIRKGRVRESAAGGPQGAENDSPGPEQLAGPAGGDPELLAQWSEFHARVERLPAEEREVFQMCYYLDMKRAEAAQVLGIHPKEASRRWIAATEKLKDVLIPLEEG
jgi:RNA polymerase sigma factor (sigma-70 family)